MFWWQRKSTSFESLLLVRVSTRIFFLLYVNIGQLLLQDYSSTLSFFSIKKFQELYAFMSFYVMGSWRKPAEREIDQRGI